MSSEALTRHRPWPGIEIDEKGAGPTCSRAWERSSETIVLGNRTGSVPAEGTWDSQILCTNIAAAWVSCSNAEDEGSVPRVRHICPPALGRCTHHILFTKAHRRWGVGHHKLQIRHLSAALTPPNTGYSCQRGSHGQPWAAYSQGSLLEHVTVHSRSWLHAADSKAQDSVHAHGCSPVWWYLHQALGRPSLW